MFTLPGRSTFNDASRFADAPEFTDQSFPTPSTRSTASQRATSGNCGVASCRSPERRTRVARKASPTSSCYSSRAPMSASIASRRPDRHRAWARRRKR
jgi:hypothetical protein